MDQKRTNSFRIIRLSYFWTWKIRLKEEARPAPVRRGVLSGVLRTVDGSPASGIVLTISGPAGSDEVVTTRAGEYRLGELLPGTYRTHIEEQGFAVDDTDGIVINPGEETHLDLSLTLHEIVQVVAFSPDATLAASTPGMSTRVVEAEEIAERDRLYSRGRFQLRARSPRRLTCQRSWRSL